RRDLDRAARVRRGDRLRTGGEQVARLALAQRGGRLGLDQVVDARRAAAQLPLGGLEQLEPGDGAQQRARLLAHALGVREVAGVVVGDLELDRPAAGGGLDGGEELGDV